MVEKEYEALAFMEIPEGMQPSEALKVFKEKVLNNEIEIHVREISCDNIFELDKNKNIVYTSNGYKEVPDAKNEAKESLKYEMKNVFDLGYTFILNGEEIYFNPTENEPEFLDSTNSLSM